jgi:molybdopterin/thiamine biosynthesis adenylyltransferase
MSAELRFTAELVRRLQEQILAPDGMEHAAVIQCGYGAGKTSLLLARALTLLSDSDVTVSAAGDHLEVSPIALAREAKRAARRGETIVVAHSHPFPGPVAASPLDLRTEKDLCGRALVVRIGSPVGALVVGPEGFDGRLWQSERVERLDVRVAGRLVGPRSPAAPDERVARQLLMWGATGQARLAAAHVAVVGAGGTGSHVAVQLAHLGVGAITLVDHDLVEVSNLSRIVGATMADVGAAKVDVLAHHLRQVRPETRVSTLNASVLDVDPSEFGGADLIVCCTDGHASRAFLTELAAQYLVTLIDLGIEVQSATGGTRAGGGVRVMRPGEPCLFCAGVIDPARVRVELLAPAERAWEAGRGYLRGLDEPAPSVIALNGVVASLAVMEVINELVGLFAGAPARLLYRAEARAVTTATTRRDDQCYVCGVDGIVGLGQDRALLGIQRDSLSVSG